MMQPAGVDERLFKPHSIRTASTSKAWCVKAGSWKSDCVFKKFYNKPIDPDQDFGQAILASAV